MTDKLRKIIEDLGWSVHHNGDGYFDLAKHSPAGEEFIIGISGHLDVELVDDILQSAKGFDAEDHAKMWIENQHVSGVPQSIRVLLKDADDIQEMLNELAGAVEIIGDTILTFDDIQDTLASRSRGSFDYYDTNLFCVIHAKFGKLQKRYTGLDVNNGLTKEFVDEFKKYFKGAPDLFKSEQDVVNYVIKHNLPVIFYNNFTDTEMTKKELLEYFEMEEVESV